MSRPISDPPHGRVSNPGTVYLLHFDPPYKHARHYMGWSEDVPERFDRHMAGRGSRLVSVALAAGCKVELVRTWPGDRHEERRLKNMKRAPELCPVCLAAKCRVCDEPAEGGGYCTPCRESMERVRSRLEREVK